jgi:hypothetical protein
MSGNKALTIKCGTHGTRVAAVVCGHMLDAKDQSVGFVENSSDPNDLQAWCAECEKMFLLEQDKTPAFCEFNRMAVVCDFCYESLKEKHSFPG